MPTGTDKKTLVILKMFADCVVVPEFFRLSPYCYASVKEANELI
jgi:hypothetical protein